MPAIEAKNWTCRTKLAIRVSVLNRFCHKMARYSISLGRRDLKKREYIGRTFLETQLRTNANIVSRQSFAITIYKLIVRQCCVLLPPSSQKYTLPIGLLPDLFYITAGVTNNITRAQFHSGGPLRMPSSTTPGNWKQSSEIEFGNQ